MATSVRLRSVMASGRSVPGELSQCRPAGPLGEKLATKARDEAALNQKRGYPLAFHLENPVT